MKRVITGLLPFLLLVLALTFMTQYKQWDDLSDSERYEIRSYVEAAETDSSETESGSASTQEEHPESNVASSSVANDDDVDPNKTYAVTNDEDTVTVYDNDGNAVFETSMEDWEENRDDYYAKYRLGS